MHVDPLDLAVFTTLLSVSTLHIADQHVWDCVVDGLRAKTTVNR